MRENSVCIDIVAGGITGAISGTVLFGPGGAAVTAMGAAINDQNVSNEALTVLVGGSLTGAIAGAINRVLRNASDTPASWRLNLGTALLGVAASLTAPLMGKLVLSNDNDWGQTIVDGLIGEAVLLGAALTARACTACCAIGYHAWSENTSFFRRAPRAPISTHAVRPPVAGIEADQVEKPQATGEEPKSLALGSDPLHPIVIDDEPNQVIETDPIVPTTGKVDNIVECDAAALDSGTEARSPKM
ncbi:MAG: hypothetical protein H2069_08025 [Legionella sp.]|nr:hypothetical protein [Legionella sp.]